MIKLYDIYKLLSEGISYDKGYKIDYDKDFVNDLIRFSDKLSFQKDTYDNTIMVGIPISQSENKNVLINDLKLGVGLSKDEQSFIIDRVVNNINDYIDINSFDYVISPKSSSSLVKNFLDILSSLNKKTIFIDNMFLKNDFKNIWLDIELAKKERPNKYVKSLIKRFDKLKSSDKEYFKLQPLNKYERRYVRDMLKVNPEHTNIIYDMMDKNILIVDDILTSGKTFDDIKNMLNVFNIKNVTFFSMFG